MALDGTENGKAFLDDVSYFNGRLAASIIIEAQRHRKPVLFMTQALEAKITCGFPTLHYDRGVKRTLFGIPLEIVYAPGVSACWVGELVFEEELEENDGHKASDVRGQQTT